MNKKGFTLIELLAVIVIIGLISLIAVPNMIGISDDVRKEQMLDDAKKLISLAKMKINIDYDARNSSTKTYTFEELNSDGEITTDPDGGSYDSSSYVIYTKADASHYCIYLQGSKRHIGTVSTCVNETNLYSKANVKDNDV
jgi:type IV pilus assembly protein PilA